MGTRIAVLMSGGVDSSVSALLLLQQGWDVTGLTLDLFRPEAPPENAEPSAAEKARQVAEFIGVPHRVLDCRDRFRSSVINPFLEGYRSGTTPNPCILCNRSVKFGFAFEQARALGFDTMATGHYARVLETDDGYGLFRARDSSKDQSYFLWAVSREDIRHVIFPMGDMTKQDARRIAREHNLPVRTRSESQDVCFLHGRDYRGLFAAEGRTGEIVHVSGQVLGGHEGTHRYTVGQRKGLGIGWGTPLYVVAIDPLSNRVTVGPREALAQQEVHAGDMNLLASVEAGDRVSVKLRSRMPDQAATVAAMDSCEFTIRLDEPAFAVTPGQSAVLYRNDRVMAGGIIQRTQIG